MSFVSLICIVYTHLASALATSSALKRPSRGCFENFKLLMKRYTYAVILLSLANELNSVGSIIASKLNNSAWLIVLKTMHPFRPLTERLTSFIDSSVSTGLIGNGHLSGCSINHLGPCFHLLSNSPAFTPLEGKSLGFSTPGTWFQCSLPAILRISTILFCTNCLYLSKSAFLIQHNATVESPQKKLSPIFNSVVSRVRLTTLHNLAAKSAARSSMRGIVIFFLGAILDLLATKLQHTPLLF